MSNGRTMKDNHDQDSRKVTFWISQAELAEWDDFTSSLDITRTQLIKDSVKEKISKPLEGINKRMEEISSNFSKFNHNLANFDEKLKKFNYNLANIHKSLWNFDERLSKIEDANLMLMKKVPALGSDDEHIDMDVRAYILTQLEDGPKKQYEFGDEYDRDDIITALSWLLKEKTVDIDDLGKWHLVG